MNKIINNILIAAAIITAPLYAQTPDNILNPKPPQINLHLSQLRPVENQYFDASDIWNIPPPSGIEWILYSSKTFPDKYTPIGELKKSYLSYKFMNNDELVGKVFFNKVPSWHSPDSYQISIGLRLRIE